jgi:hypothetical protein
MLDLLRSVDTSRDRIDLDGPSVQGWLSPWTRAGIIMDCSAVGTESL